MCRHPRSRGECPPPGPGHPGSGQKQSSQKWQDPEQEKAEISFYPQDLLCLFSGRVTICRSYPRKERKGPIGQTQQQSLCGVFQHQEPSADSQRSLSGGGPTVGFPACLESSVSSFHTDSHRQGASWSSRKLMGFDSHTHGLSQAHTTSESRASVWRWFSR